MQDRRVVHENVDAAVTLDRLRNDARPVGVVRDVDGKLQPKMDVSIWHGPVMVQQGRTDNVGRFFAPKFWLAPLIIGIDMVIVLVALKFMWDIRHAKASNHG